MVGELKTKLGFAQGVLNGIPSPCGIVGPDFTMSWVNQEICDLLEKPQARTTAIGQRSGAFYNNDANRQTLSDRAIQERQPLAAEIDYSAPSGRKLRVAVRTTPFFDLDGNMLGSISFWNDLTQLHEQNRRIEEQNAVIAQTAASASAVADRVAAASEELSAQIEQSSRGAEEQNGRVQETATAVEEMNATILEVARNAAATATQADLARDKARQGAGLVAEVEAAVGSIRDEAVVLTSNMQTLGQQAQGIGATKEVGQAITGIQQGTADAVTRVERAVTRVGTASELAARSGASLSEIVAVVETAGDQVRAIAAAAEQQSATSEEINRSVESISSIASETAQAMHQSAQAVSDLARQANDLNCLMSQLQDGAAAPKALR